MKILAIETSCDETAAAVVEDARIIHSSVVYSQIEEHRLYGGVVPEIASRRHAEQIVRVVGRALLEANLGWNDPDAVAVTHGPGLIGALLVGVGFAKGLASSLKRPLIPVHHIRGHVASCMLTSPDLAPPFLCLVASGGHSHIVEVLTHTEYRVIGRTRDDAAGEAFDKAARVLGLPYPGGAELDKLSQSGVPGRYRLPIPKVEGNPYDMSFSGLKTAVINLVHNAQQKGEALHEADLAADFSHTVADALAGRLFAAADELGYHTLACAGGVSANSTLRKTLDKRAEASGRRVFVPNFSLCGDNAAMIGAQAFYEYQAGNVADSSLNAYASLDIAQPFGG